MQRVFFSALALVLGSTQINACEDARCVAGDVVPAECNSIGCVRPTNALENLAKIANRTLSTIRVTELSNVRGLCGTGICAIELAAPPLAESCGRTGCAAPEPKSRTAAAADNDGASIHAPVMDAFAAVAKRPVRLLPWAEWTHRWGFGALYNPRLGIERLRS
jgi:hypothetical protein